MIRPLSLLLVIQFVLHAAETHTLYELYQNGRYLQACDAGIKTLGEHKNDEKYISLYAFSCLQADKIDRLALPIIMLKHSSEARKNAAYFSTILLQKNLLISALENGQSLATLNLPTTGYILSVVFDLFCEQHFTKESGGYVITDPKNPRQNYRLYRNGSELFIDEYYDTILTKQHIYR